MRERFVQYRVASLLLYGPKLKQTKNKIRQKLSCLGPTRATLSSEQGRIETYPGWRPKWQKFT